MYNKVRVYDGEGNLKKIITPSFDEPTSIMERSYKPHACKICGSITERMKYCSEECTQEAKRISQAKASIKASQRREIRLSKIKQTPCQSRHCMKMTRDKYCSTECRKVEYKYKRVEHEEMLKKERLSKRNDSNHQLLNA